MSSCVTLLILEWKQCSAVSQLPDTGNIIRSFVLLALSSSNQQTLQDHGLNSIKASE